MLRIEGLSAGYSAKPVLNGVSINVAAGQFVAIVGPNGAGKTTLFKAISGTVAPASGTISFEGRDLSDAGDTVRFWFTAASWVSSLPQRGR